MSFSRVLVRGWALFLVRGWELFLVRVDQDTIPSESRPGHYFLSESRKIISLTWVTWTCRQFGLAWTYDSREGDMSWGRGPG